MIRRSVFILAAVVAMTGCTPRAVDQDGMKSYTEGGYGSPFYAEVAYAAKEGQKPRIYLFGKIAHYERFVATREVPENQHKKYIGKGRNRETLVVQDVVGYELKDNPAYADQLVARYQARHGAPVPAAEAAAP